MQWEMIIGLEVHAQLNTKSKIFSGSSTRYGAKANENACAIDLGLPGVLPVLNKAVVEKAIRFGLAINANICQDSIFARKNYFYPDLPKGYQISQYAKPIVQGGYLDIILENGKQKRVHITRAHLEEDAGKSLHENFEGVTALDFNRAGTPLLEIVSEPELRSAKQAVAYLKILHSLVRTIEICDGNMQEGSFRCDANVSVRPIGQSTLGTRCEIKNINSFRFVEIAINYEAKRQIDILENHGHITQETRLFDPDSGKTFTMRSKEDAQDYRYFPDPDLLPVIISDEWIAQVNATLPELPSAKLQRFIDVYGLSEDKAQQISNNLSLAKLMDDTCQISKASSVMIANWILGELSAYLNQHDIDASDCPISAKQLSDLVEHIDNGTLSQTIAKTLLATLWQQGGVVAELIQQQGLAQISDSDEIKKIIAEIIAQHPDQVAQYKAGKEKVFGFFVGQVMKISKGKANPSQVNALLKTALANN